MKQALVCEGHVKCIKKNFENHCLFFVYARWLTSCTSWTFASFHCTRVIFSQYICNHWLKGNLTIFIFISAFWTWIVSDTPSRDAFCKFLECRLDCTSCLLHLSHYDEAKQNCDMGCVETLPPPIRAFVNRQAWNVIPGILPSAGPSSLSALFVLSPFSGCLTDSLCQCLWNSSLSPPVEGRTPCLHYCVLKMASSFPLPRFRMSRSVTIQKREDLFGLW